MSPWPPKPADIPPLVSGAHEWPEREGLRVMAVHTWDDVPDGWYAVSQVERPVWPPALFDLLLLAQVPPRADDYYLHRRLGLAAPGVTDRTRVQLIVDHFNRV